MNLNRFDAWPRWHCTPLRRNCPVVMFEGLFVPANVEGVAQPWRLRWAIGVLTDGQHEISGMWLTSAANALDLWTVVDELKNRDVESIRFAAGSDLTDEAPATSAGRAARGIARPPTGALRL